MHLRWVLPIWPFVIPVCKILEVSFKCWSNIFWLLWGFIRWCVNVFLFVCSKQERISNAPSEVFFFTNFCLVLNIRFFFMPQRSGDFFWKKVANWRSGQRHFVEIVFQKNDMKKKLVFYIRKTNAIIWYYHLLYQKSKKKSILKKVVFSLNVTFFKNCLQIFFDWEFLGPF